MDIEQEIKQLRQHEHDQDKKINFLEIEIEKLRTKLEREIDARERLQNKIHQLLQTQKPKEEQPGQAQQPKQEEQPAKNNNQAITDSDMDFIKNHFIFCRPAK